MRPIIAFPACASLLAFAACAGTPPASEESKVALCDASKVQWAIGKTGDQATMGQIWRQSGAGLFRPEIEGQAIKRDKRPDRVNVHLDGDNRIVAIDCG